MESRYSIFGDKDQEPPIFVWARTALNVPKNASADEIKKAYRKLSLEWHPDRHIGKPTKEEAEKKFKIYSGAHSILYEKAGRENAIKEFSEALQSPFQVGERHFCIGVLYGRRIWIPEKEKVRITDTRRMLTGKVDASGTRERLGEAKMYNVRSSILGDDLEDLLETYYGGEPETRKKIKGMEKTPEELHQIGFEKRHEGGIDDLPWIKGNNLALHYFMKGEFDSSVKLLEQCNLMVHKNVIFMYREGVCHEARAAKSKKDYDFWRADMTEAIRLYEGALALKNNPESRLTIMMQLADAYGEIGWKDKAGELWRQIKVIDPNCYEAIFKAKERLGLAGEKVVGFGRRLLGKMGL